MAITPNMNLSLPSPSVTAGPTWATNVNTAFSVVDTHDHSPGRGSLIPATALNITSDLSLNNTAKLLQVKSLNLAVQDTALPAANAQAVYSISGDLWYNNSAGTPVQLTAGNSITSASSPLTPAGIILAYGGSSAPTGYLLCDGTAVSKTGYAGLFSAIGTAYNVGGEATTDFRLPNLLGRGPIGSGTYIDPVSGSITRTLGATLGAEAHVLTQAQLASHSHAGIAHSHGITDPGHAHNIPTFTDNPGANTVFATAAPDAFPLFNSHPTSTVGTGISVNAATSSVATTGTNASHNNMQPSTVVNFIIKT
jgi:microcystin-dependent protein